jgi:hypothetical protein
MHMWHHVTNHLITSNDKDSNSENRIKLRVHDKNDNQDITVLPEQVFARAMEVIPNHMAQNEATLKPWIDPHQLKQHQGIWYKDGRQVVTGDNEAKHHIIQSHHNSPVYGHPGISKTIQLTERLYWWPQMRIDITEYIKGCAECQRHKVNT